MSSEFLDDLTRAGNAVWEHYLKSCIGKGEQDPPAFPVWEAVPEAEAFYVKYRATFDWRAWVGTSMAFSCMACAAALAADDAQDFDNVHKFAELLAIHMGRRCPGGHADHAAYTADVLREGPEYPAPTWEYGGGDMGKFRFAVAAHQEWLHLQGTFIPERELSPERQNAVLDLSSDIENELFQAAELSTLIGLMVLCSHMAAQSMYALTTAQEDTARRVQCTNAHGMEHAVHAYMVEWQMMRTHTAILSQAFDPRLN